MRKPRTESLQNYNAETMGVIDKVEGVPQCFALKLGARASTHPNDSHVQNSPKVIEDTDGEDGGFANGVRALEG